MQLSQRVGVEKGLGVVAGLVKRHDGAAVLCRPCINLAATALGEGDQAFEQVHAQQAEHRLEQQKQRLTEQSSTEILPPAPVEQN